MLAKWEDQTNACPNKTSKNFEIKKTNRNQIAQNLKKKWPKSAVLNVDFIGPM